MSAVTLDFKPFRFGPKPQPCGCYALDVFHEGVRIGAVFYDHERGWYIVEPFGSPVRFFGSQDAAANALAKDVTADMAEKGA